MKRPLIKRLKRSPIWIIVAVGLLVAAGLLLVVAFLNPGRATTAPERTATLSSTAAATSTTVPPDTPTPEPEPTSESIAASVNGYTITQSYLNQTVRLNDVLGDLSGAATLDEKETLQRLIRSQLILQGVTTTDEPAQEDVESLIAALENNWGITDETLVQRLQEVGLDRAFLEDTISRLLKVQAGVESLEEEGYDVSEWLMEQEEDADIMVFEDLASAEPTIPPTEQIEPPTLTPGPQPEVPAVAPDFTLNQAGGGSFTLRDQLEESPVVLVFFEKCG